MAVTAGDADAKATQAITTITDGLSAVASSVDTLAVNYNGLTASLTTQSGAISGLQERTSAYWRTTAVAGDNRAQITVSADANAGAGVDIVGDVRIRGDLIVTGTIIASKLKENEGVDLAAVVPGELNWRAAYIDTADLGPASSVDSGIVPVGAVGTVTSSSVVTITEAVQSGWASAQTGVDANNDGVFEYYMRWATTLEIYYRINGGPWVNSGLYQTYQHGTVQGNFLWNSGMQPRQSFSPQLAGRGTLQLGVRCVGGHENPAGSGAIYDRTVRFEVVNWK